MDIPSCGDACCLVAWFLGRSYTSAELMPWRSYGLASSRARLRLCARSTTVLVSASLFAFIWYWFLSMSCRARSLRASNFGRAVLSQMFTPWELSSHRYACEHVVGLTRRRRYKQEAQCVHSCTARHVFYTVGLAKLGCAPLI